MRAFVTGATGFVGSHLVDVLLARGWQVTALARSRSKAAPLAERGVTIASGDLDDDRALAAGCDGADTVFHVAALTGAVDEAEFLHANRDGTARVLRAAGQSGTPVRFVYVSSMAAGGPARRGSPQRAETTGAPVTMYGRSKRAGEEVVRGSGVPWTILRPPAVYGPRDRDNFLALFKAARGGIAPVFGDGSMELSLVHVRDLAEAIERAAHGAAVLGGVWYVNHPETLTSRALVETVARTMGRRVRVIGIPEPVARAALTLTGGIAGLTRRRTILRADKANEFFQPAWTGDAGPFIAATGWAPRFDAAHGLADTYRWYREAGWL